MDLRFFSYSKIVPEEREREYIGRLFNRSYVFIYFFLLQFIVNNTFRNFLKGTGIEEPIYRVAFLPLFWSIIIYLALSAIKSKKIYRWIFIVMAIFSCLSFIFEMFLLEAYHDIYSYTIAYAILATNPTETQEFWTSTVQLSLFYTPILWFLGVCFIAYFVHLLVCPLRIHSKKLVYCLLFTPLLVGIGYFYPRMLHLYFINPGNGIAFATLTPVERYFWSSFLCLYDAYETEKTFQLLSKNNGRVKVSRERLLEPHTIVLILGESLRSDYMHCYGYSLPNTPRIDSLLACNAVTLFSDVVSCSNGTGSSIAEMMSFRTVETPGKWYESDILIDIMNSAGYKTFWLSRQEQYSVYVRTVSALAQLCHKTMYTVKGHDEAVLPYLQAHTVDEPFFFQIVHLNGSHIAYKDRYPQEFTRFSISDLPFHHEDAERNQTTVHYINSIYFNDYVVSSIIKYYSDKDAIVIYVSDHGQAIYDDPQNPNFAGHSFSLGGISIPLLFYLSPSMEKKYPKLKEQILSAKDRRIMTDLLPYAIAGVAGLNFGNYDESLDFLSPRYNNDRKRVARSGDKQLIVDK